MAELSVRATTPTRVADRLSRARTTLAFASFAALFALLIFVVETLSLVGVPDTVLLGLMTMFALFVPVLATFPTVTVSLPRFAVAQHQVTILQNAVAMCSGLFGSVFLVGIASTFYRSELEMAALVLGSGSGLLMSGVLFAPFLRRAGCSTGADFLGARFGSSLVSATAGAIAMLALAPMLVAEISVAVMIGNWTLGLPKSAIAVLSAALMAIPALLGGMRAITLAATMQFLLLFFALVAVSVWLSWSVAGHALPFEGYLAAARALQEAEILNASASPETWRAAALGAGVAAGMAVFPTLLMRAAAARSSTSARSSLARCLFVFAWLCLSSATIGAIAKWSVFEAPAKVGSVAELVSQGWIVDWVVRDDSLVELCGEPASEAGANCPSGPLPRGALSIDPDIALVAAPGIAGLPPLTSLLLAVACLVASVAAGALTLFGIARSLGQDVLSRPGPVRTSPSLSLLIQRGVIVASAIIAVPLALSAPADYLRVAVASLTIAASGTFPALLLGIWWPRATGTGAVCGMIAGFAIAAFQAVGTLRDPSLFDTLEPLRIADYARMIGLEGAGLIAIAAGVVITIAVSLLTKKPDDSRMAFTDALRMPRDLNLSDGT
jgi:cation/acetate symporter